MVGLLALTGCWPSIVTKLRRSELELKPSVGTCVKSVDEMSVYYTGG